MKTKSTSIARRVSTIGSITLAVVLLTASGIVSVTLIRDANQRVQATGTLQGEDHPAYATVKAGKSFSGRAVLFGRADMTHYQPVRSDEGKLIGLLFVGSDLDAFERCHGQSERQRQILRKRRHLSCCGQ